MIIHIGHKRRGLNWRPHERRGTVGVWVVVSLLALLGMMALVVDVGRLTVAASHVQNVVDAAALAGAAKLPDYDAAETNVQRTISGNNLDNPSWAVSCTPAEDIVYYAPGDTVPDYGVLESEENAIEVTGHTVVPYTFARIFGIESVTVTRSATAKAKPGGRKGTGIFFAGETRSTKWGIIISGSDHYVDGTIHSNTKVKFTGSHQIIEEDVEYLHEFREVGSGHEVRGDIVEDRVRPWPVDYTWEQYDQGPWDYEIWGDLRKSGGETIPPGRYRIHGDFHVSGSGFSCHDVLIVADEDIRFTGSDHILDRVTLVSKDDIVFTGSLRRYSWFVDNLFAFALKEGNSALRVSGSKTDTYGILYAPNGELSYTGSKHELHHGALIANIIDINGSDGRFCGLGESGADGRPEIVLIR
ncbi:MAG: hypothetical protein J7M38_15855 [Armatimonadetes bacterium]|nr:hypothetical protein [Armatimonadota bacterium]